MTEQCEIRVGEMLISKCGEPASEYVRDENGKLRPVCEYHYGVAILNLADDD